MATPTELSVLLRLYTGKQNSPSISLIDFTDYLQKYARHYLQEAPDLAMWLEDTQTTVLKELDRLSNEGRAVLTTDQKGHRYIFVPQFYIDRFTSRYREIEERTEVPFPLPSELPSLFPSALLRQVYITTDFTDVMEDAERATGVLYQLMFPDETSPLLYPGTLPPARLLELALAKIRLFLRKDESRDYIQKRIMMANPGKEITIKNYLTQFQTRPSDSLDAFRHSGEAFIFWSYLCSFIRQDYAKKNEKTPEETALMQSVFIVEYLNNYYKNKVQQELQCETALKNLELAFQKPPYFFDMDAILRFTDSRGIPLLGQYKNTDLENFIKSKTGNPESHSLPELLAFRSRTNVRYFLLKEKVYPMIVRLCNESRKSVKEAITKEWHSLLLKFRQDEAMNNQAAFEKKLEALCSEQSPMLHAVLNASFIPLLAMETPSQSAETPASFKIFNHGRLLPWSELLMLNRQELLTDTRILLPFWYTIPIISSLLSFLRRPRKKKTRAHKKENRESPLRTEDRTPSGSTGSAKDERDKLKHDLRNAAFAVGKRLIPPGSSLESEMEEHLEHWNRTLDQTAKQNLTEDVNSLIRDYIRRILRTLRASSFDENRIENLAQTLVDTPSLMKIKNRDALLAYTRLYILYLISNMK